MTHTFHFDPRPDDRPPIIKPMSIIFYIQYEEKKIKGVSRLTKGKEEDMIIKRSWLRS